MSDISPPTSYSEPPTVEAQVLAQYVLGHFGYANGPKPGSFYESLIVTIAKADPSNRARLSQGFPMLVDMMTAAQDSPDGVNRLHAASQTGEWSWVR